MAIQSYFYDSVEGDRKYSASDFAKAFGMVLETGVIANDASGKLGFDIGGTNYTTIFAGKAVIQGRFVEVTETEILSVPSGSYAGQVVIRVDTNDLRTARLIVKTDQSPVQGAAFYELPLYNATVSNGVITSVRDLRAQGGALAKMSPDMVKWIPDTNGVRAHMGFFAGTGKPVILYLTSAQPAASSAEHRVWIQIDKF